MAKSLWKPDHYTRMGLLNIPLVPNLRHSSRKSIRKSKAVGNWLIGHKSIGEVKQKCAVGLRSMLYAGYQPWQATPSWSSLCAQGHCHARLSLLVPVKGNYNVTAFRDVLFSCVHPALWQQLRGRVTYGCDGQVSTSFWPYNVDQFGSHLWSIILDQFGEVLELANTFSRGFCL